ncbi:MAG TPA: acyltransferase, partial [Pseudonocardiaceae bacterium]|nr:acyltransferase [Pseudonocardiaceae bacterium]
SGALPFGWLGVPVFFVLSGHFITRILFERGTSLRAFVRNRLLRLAPLYLLACLALTVLAISGFGPSQLPGDLPYLWTWTYDLRPLASGWIDNNLYDHLWSLGVEVQLYALWALLAVTLSRRWLVRIVVALAVAGPLLRIAVWGVLSVAGYPHAELADITYCLPTTYLDAFAIGACTALPEIRDRLASARRLIGLCCGALGLVVLGQVGLGLLRHGRFQADLGFPIALPYQAGWVWGYSLIALAAGSLLLACPRVFAWPPLARLGLISYGVYLVHRPIGQLCERLLPMNPVATGIIVLCVTVPLAELSYRRFELAFIRRKRDSLSTQPHAWPRHSGIAGYPRVTRSVDGPIT